MPDKLTAEELAAIARYDGPIYKAKRGESAFDIGEPIVRLNNFNRATRAKRKFENDQIRSLRERGMTDPEIAEALKMGLPKVKARRLREGIA